MAACETLSTWSKETQTLPSVTEVRERRDTGIKKHVVAEYPRKCVLAVNKPSSSKLPHWRRTSDYAVAEYYTVVLERPPASHVGVNYHKIALDEQKRQRIRARSNAKVTRGGRWRLGREEANER